MNREGRVSKSSSPKPRHLSEISSPDQLKALSPEELSLLAAEIRERIIEVMSKNGGHLASNLGSVELTLALHQVFSSPEDKIIFDVSHQAYTHKLLTGRSGPEFDLIRNSGGLSGFCHPEESCHDHFFAGHAGTGLSLALGMAASRSSDQRQNHVIAVIGDASLSCGLTFEALNNISKATERLIVVLNDNAMSISHNVGGMTSLLSRLVSNPTTSLMRREVSGWLHRIPLVGKALARQAKRFTSSVKNLVSSAPFFEQFGLSYIGPIDGHDLKKLTATFEAIKDFPMPLLVHLYTKKGYGLKKAEADPITFHGVKPFNLETCEFLPTKSSAPTFPKIFGKHLLQMGERDPDLQVVTPAMSLGSCLDPFMEKFKGRAYDVGIAEGHAVTFSGGLAKTQRKRVICSIYATFLQRAFDNLFHDVCLQAIPVVFAIDRAGLAFADGATHHGIYDIGFLKSMPNMVICQPRNGDLLKELLDSCFDWNLPVAIRYPNIETQESARESRRRPLGKGEILAEGEDLIIVALGAMAKTALTVRGQLIERGIFATVVDPIFVKPLDRALLLELCSKHSRLVTLEEHSLKSGLGAEVASFLFENGLGQIDLLQIGVPDQFYHHKNSAEFLDAIGLSAVKIEERILASFFAEQPLMV